MIRVRMEVTIGNVTMEFDKETIAMLDSDVINTEKAQSLLLEAYHKMKKGIESQR